MPPSSILFLRSATSLITLAGLGWLAVMHQDEPVITAWSEVLDDASRLGTSFSKAVKETVAFGRRIGGADGLAPIV